MMAMVVVSKVIGCDSSAAGAGARPSSPRVVWRASSSCGHACLHCRYTQKLKNKDIPESGSKGTILLKQGKNDRDSLAFQQYVDAILDITMKDDGVTDLYKQKEYLFFGPDENTAGFMDGACLCVLSQR